MTKRRLLIGASALLVVLLVVAAVASWWVAGQIWAGAFPIEYGALEYDVEVVGHDPGSGRVVLHAPGHADLANPGIFGLEWPDGYGRLGAVIEERDGEVERAFEMMAGMPPGIEARIDSFAFPGDPLLAHGIAFEDVVYEGETTSFPAWYVPGSSDTWAIAVHGRTSDRAEALRLLPELTERDLPALVITYRNDREAATGPGGVYTYGTTEWADLEGAVQYALDHGAEDVLLVGYSMGGAIITSFLDRSELAGSVRAVILDAPLLDLRAAADMQLRDGGVPGPLTGAMRWVAARRYDIDWDAMNYLDDVDAFDAPVLLIHGTGDAVVPVGTSRALAEARRDVVTYVELPGVGHVRGWNEANEEYLAAVAAFLERALADQPIEAGVAIRP